MGTLQDVRFEWIRDRELDIVYYGEELNGPCCKVRMIMHMYGFRYTSVDGLKPRQDYKHIPVVDIEGVQFNESYHISQVLHKIATGRDPTHHELRMEMELTYEVTEALRVSLASNAGEVRRLANYLRGSRWCLFTCFACVAPRTAAAVRKAHPNLLSLEEYGDSFTFHLGDGNFFGGDNPSFIDGGLFGVLESYRGVCEGPNRFLGKEGKLRDWYNRMVALDIPSIFEDTK